MLSKDSKIVLYKLYKEFTHQRKNGISKSKAKLFPSAQELQKALFSDWILSDLEDSLRELGRNKYLNNLYADNTIYFCELSDLAIATMENLPTNTLSSIADFLINFIPLL